MEEEDAEERTHAWKKKGRRGGTQKSETGKASLPVPPCPPARSAAIQRSARAGGADIP